LYKNIGLKESYIFIKDMEVEDKDVKNDSILKAVIEKFEQRSAVGFKKYGVTLDRTDLSVLDSILHAQEELMDAILYLQKLPTLFT
jgi:hypothetical protein